MLRAVLVAVLAASVSPAAGMARPQFGAYTDHYYDRKWKKLCKGPGRYDAMREAYAMGKPDPCSKK